jgi:hypothetical protein
VSVTLAPFPVRTGVTLEGNRLMTRPWVAWITDLVERVNASAPRVSSVEVTGKSASIGTTTLPRDSSAEGMYRVGYFARITTAATTSSSLTVTVGGTNGGVAVSFSGAAITGNTTSTVQSGTFYLQSDGGTNLTYATTYASSGGTAMQYGLWMTVERVKA